MTGSGLPRTLALAVLGLVAGVGITAIGPGGVLVTIGLFALTGLTPAQVSGTAIVTHVATGVLATAAYARSGHLGVPGTRRTAVLLAGAASAGTPLGVLANGAVSGRAFGVLLAAFVTLVAALVWYRDRHPGRAVPGHALPASVVVAAGFAVAAVSGVFGVGGPLLSVPTLVALGVPVLPALAAAQVQSVVVAGVGTLGYLTAGAVDWPLSVLVGVPELAGVLLGWRIARALPTRALTYALVVTLLALAPYLALHGRHAPTPGVPGRMPHPAVRAVRPPGRMCAWTSTSPQSARTSRPSAVAWPTSTDRAAPRSPARSPRRWPRPCARASPTGAR